MHPISDPIADQGPAPEPKADLQFSRELYDQLRSLARQQMLQERKDHTLQPTALVNEAWLRLLQAEAEVPTDVMGLLRLAGLVMRRVLVDHARQRLASKRGNGVIRLALEPDLIPDNQASDSTEVLALEEALVTLEKLDPGLAEVASARLFGGLSCAEIASLEDSSVRTVERRWMRAKEVLTALIAEEPCPRADPFTRPDVKP